MKASVERLRWGLAASALLLIVVVGGFLGYGRYKQLMRWRDTLKRLNLHGPHETLGFTYSSSPKDRTSYKVRADRVVEHGDGTYSFYNVAVTLYSKTSDDEDHIYASHIEYDNNTGVARAIGEVHMDLQVAGALHRGKPAGETVAPAANEEEDARVIHIKTSELVYVKKLDVAATNQPVEFRYAGMQCTSRGAEFDSGESQLHLLADVVMNGTVRHAPLTVRAVKADLNREDNTIELDHPVAQSQGRTATAEHALAHLRNDGSVEQADAGGGVTMDAETRHITAESYSGTFGTTSLPVTGKLSGNVVATDTNPARPMRAQANEVDANFDTAGNPTIVTATGAAQAMMTARRPGVADLPREIHGDRIVAHFVSLAKPGMRQRQSVLSDMDATGSAMARGLSPAAGNGGLKSTQVNADDLRAVFDDSAPNKPEVRQVFGSGHTRLDEKAPLGEQQTSTADTLQAEFAKPANGGPATLQIVSATQTGNVVLHSISATKPGAQPQPPSDATADRAVYDGISSKLTLTGSAHFAQDQTALRASSITVEQHTGDAEADGSVLATLSGSPQPKAAPSSGPAGEQVTHVAADRATLLHVSQLAEFYGSANHPARLWQGASQVQAATLLFDQKRKSLSARPAPGAQVHAVFAGTSADAAAPRPGARSTDQDQVVRVSSATMDYNDVDREATFNGNVHMDGSTAQAQSQHGVVFLNPAQPSGQKAGAASPFGGSLRRIVLTDNVHVEQPGRTGTGEELVYTAADGTYILTGTAARPPRVVDAQQGNITGATLLFHAADSTIVVGGTNAAGKPGRVRTETEVRGK